MSAKPIDEKADELPRKLRIVVNRAASMALGAESVGVQPQQSDDRVRAAARIALNASTFEDVEVGIGSLARAVDDRVIREPMNFIRFAQQSIGEALVALRAHAAGRYILADDMQPPTRTEETRRYRARKRSKMTSIIIPISDDDIKILVGRGFLAEAVEQEPRARAVAVTAALSEALGPSTATGRREWLDKHLRAIVPEMFDK